MKLWLTLLTIAWLTGCATHTELSTFQPELWQQHLSKIRGIRDWQAIAKVSIKTNKKGISANLDWTQKGKSYRMALSGPMGFGKLVIDGTRELARIQQNGETVIGKPEVLVFDVTGIALPIDTWRWWLRGIPAPKDPTTKFVMTTAHGHAESFVQSGWSLSFSKYRRTAAGYLPSRIIGRSDKISFKMLVSKWITPEEI